LRWRWSARWWSNAPPRAFDAFGRVAGAGEAADAWVLVAAAAVAAVHTAAVSNNDWAEDEKAVDLALLVLCSTPRP